jgi:hypothetical protein
VNQMVMIQLTTCGCIPGSGRQVAHGAGKRAEARRASSVPHLKLAVEADEGVEHDHKKRTPDQLPWAMGTPERT